MQPQDPGEAVPGRAPDPRADHLHGGHERIGIEHGPRERVAELRAGLAICGNATWIVVRGAGDETRTKNLQKPGFGRGDNWARIFGIIVFG